MKSWSHRSHLVSRLVTFGVLLAFSARGQVFISNENFNTVSEFSLSGAVMNLSFITGLDQPIGLAVIGNDLFVVNNFRESIAEYTTSGMLVNANFATGLINPSGLVAQGNSLYVSTASVSAGDQIMKINGGTTSLFATLGSVSSGGIGGMAFDSHGNLFASLAVGVIKEISPNGSSITTFATSVSPSFNLTSPAGLAFDGSGNLYVADSASAQIKWYTPDGTYKGVFASGNLNQPGSMAFDAQGNLDVANGATSAIEQFSPTGSALGVFANANQGSVGAIVIAPEPSTLALLGVCFGTFGLIRYKRIRARASVSPHY